MKRNLKLLVGAVSMVVAAAAPALAHVTVQPPEAVGDSFSAFVVRVPNERDNAATTKVKVQFPTLTSVGFMDVEGWTRTVKMKKLDEPIEVFGEEVNEVIGTVTWSGGSVAPGEFAEFPFSAHMPVGEEELEFAAIQTYDNGEVVRWTGPGDSETPAALVHTVELGEAGEEVGSLGALHNVVHEVEELTTTVQGLEETVQASASASSDESEDEGSDTLPIVLGAVGVGLGLIALIVALSRGRSTT